MKKIIAAIVCSIFFSSCGTSHKVIEDDANVRWPDFLRDWAVDYEINDVQHLAIIDQIDTVYKLIEDSTSNDDLLCTNLCKLQDVISDAIKYDSSLVFSLMMRATCRNIYGVIYRSPWLLEKKCSCEVLNYLILDGQWNTSSRTNLDLMYTTITGLSWQASERFANLLLGKEDGNDIVLSLLLVYNYTDTIINNLQLTFIDSKGNILDTLTENDIYVDSSVVCVKQMQVPPYLIMAALADNGTITISYETPNGIVEMHGFPHMFFKEQIDDCPRLKDVFNQALAE